jgi:hypothetical protein
MNIGKLTLVKTLKLLWKLWDKQFPAYRPSSINTRIDGDDEYDKFINENGKLINVNPKDIDQYYFWYHALSENEDELGNNTLSVDNVVVPEERELKYELKVVYWEKMVKTGEEYFTGYMTEEQFENSFYDLVTEDYLTFDINYTYHDIVDTKWVDETLERVIEVTKEQQESIDKIVNTLTESELKYLTETIIKKNLKR